MRTRCGLVFAFLCLAAAVAQAAPPQCNESIGPGFATFCEGYYALCIKARCKPAAQGSNQAECACAVEQGWSMGPEKCSDPGRNQTTPPAANATLMSTYSNLFNTSEKTLTCAPDTRWAWCYGAPCRVDAKDPSKATCRCPVCTSAASTLGGDCKHVNCKEIWSAATPKNDAFANNHYYKYLTGKGVQVPPAATACRQ